MFLNDPFKEIFGVAKENLTYIGDYDPARYTNTDNEDNIENDFVFNKDNVGELGGILALVDTLNTNSILIDIEKKIGEACRFNCKSL